MKIVRAEKEIGNRREEKKSIVKSLNSRERDKEKRMQVKCKISLRLC